MEEIYEVDLKEKKKKKVFGVCTVDTVEYHLREGEKVCAIDKDEEVIIDLQTLTVKELYELIGRVKKQNELDKDRIEKRFDFFAVTYEEAGGDGDNV